MPQSKKSTSGMGSIRKITREVNGKTYTYYEARYTAGFDPGTGKQIQRSITDKSKKVVAQKLKAALAALDAGTYTNIRHTYYSSCQWHNKLTLFSLNIISNKS